MKTKQELMIHAWHDKYLDIDLENYILSFDDGLVSQVSGIEKIVQKFPKAEIRYHISTGLINIHGFPITFNESDVAHKIYQETGCTGDFVSYDDLIHISKIPNVKVGLHGHKHLNLQHLQKNKSLHDQFKIWDKDLTDMMFSTIQLVQSHIINQGVIYFCMPYNQNFPLYIAAMRKKFSVYFPESEFVITGAGRININSLPQAPTFVERYDSVLDNSRREIVNAMRIPPEYFIGSGLEKDIHE